MLNKINVEQEYYSKLWHLIMDHGTDVMEHPTTLDVPKILLVPPFHMKLQNGSHQQVIEIWQMSRYMRIVNTFSSITFQCDIPMKDDIADSWFNWAYDMSDRILNPDKYKDDPRVRCGNFMGDYGYLMNNPKGDGPESNPYGIIGGY